MTRAAALQNDRHAGAGSGMAHLWRALGSQGAGGFLVSGLVDGGTLVLRHHVAQRHCGIDREPARRSLRRRHHAIRSEAGLFARAGDAQAGRFPGSARERAGTLETFPTDIEGQLMMAEIQAEKSE